MALRISRDPALAADATHDAFVQAWRSAGGFDPARESASAWIVGLVRSRALDLVRRLGRAAASGDRPELSDDVADPLQRLLSSADGAALHRRLEELEDLRRQLIVLAFVEGLSHSELAERTSLPLGTVKSWIRRGLDSLRGCRPS